MGLKNHNETKAYHIKIIESLNKKINIFNINFNIDFKGWRGNLDFITISINSSLLKEFNSIDKIPLNLLKYKTKNIHIKILFIILYYFDKQKVILNLEELFKTIGLKQNFVQNSYKLKQHLLNFQNENVLKSYTFQNWYLHLNLSNLSDVNSIWKPVKIFTKEEKKIFRKGLKIKINKDIEKEKELKIEISKKLEGLYWNNYIIKNEHYLEKIGSIDTILINKKDPEDIFIIEYKLNSDKRVVSQAEWYSYWYKELNKLKWWNIKIIIIQKNFRMSDFWKLKQKEDLYFYKYENRDWNLIIKPHVFDL